MGRQPVPITPITDAPQMSRRHGRATMPWGKWKRVRVSLLPDDYLSFLTTLPMLRTEQWTWLWDSILSELRFRGLRADIVDNEEMGGEVPAPVAIQEELEMDEPAKLKAKRGYRFDRS